jgi:hypothetical protein
VDLIREIHAAPGGSEALVLIWRYILATNGQAAPEASERKGAPACVAVATTTATSGAA